MSLDSVLTYWIHKAALTSLRFFYGFWAA